MEIEVFKLMIYSFGFDTENIYKQCYPSFRQKVQEHFGMETQPGLFKEWLVELKDRITSFSLVANDETTVSEVLFLLKNDYFKNEKSVQGTETVTL